MQSHPGERHWAPRTIATRRPVQNACSYTRQCPAANLLAKGGKGLSEEQSLSPDRSEWLKEVMAQECHINSRFSVFASWPGSLLAFKASLSLLPLSLSG